MLERAVINTGPLVALALLDKLDLLPAMFAECWVPQAVFNEVAVAGIGKLEKYQTGELSVEEACRRLDLNMWDFLLLLKKRNMALNVNLEDWLNSVQIRGSGL